jgi:hypothetical protein
MKNSSSFIFYFLLLALFSSCSLQKRNYLPGYYISWNSSRNDSKSEKKELAAVKQIENINRIDAQTAAQLEDRVPLLTPVQFKPSYSQDFDPCDTLILRNGTEIKAKVLEINPNEIKYKYCNNLNGPLIIVSKSDVQLIKYANGQRDEFPEKPASTFNNHQMADEFYIHKQAQSALLCGILAFVLTYFGIIGAIIAIIRGRRAISMIGNDPFLRMRYYGQARAGVILGIIYLSIVALILLVLLAGFLI